jgi:hypothetical protein
MDNRIFVKPPLTFFRAAQQKRAKNACPTCKKLEKNSVLTPTPLENYL